MNVKLELLEAMNSNDLRGIAILLSDTDIPDETIEDLIFSLAWNWKMPLDRAGRDDQMRQRAKGISNFCTNEFAARHAVERMLPSPLFKIGNDGGPNAEVEDTRTGDSFTSVGPTLAAALLSATFHVLASRASEKV